MAQMTPEEFIEALESVTEALRNNKTANQQQAEGLMKSWGANTKYTDEVLKSSKAFGTSSATMVKGMYKGGTSAQSMAASLDTVTTGLDLFLTAFFPQAKLLVKVLDFLTKTLFGAGKVITEQAQAEFKAYQQLNQVGAAGAQGLQGVFDTVQKFGYNVNELDKMVALVAANSETLAQFGGLASKGTNEFANAMNQLTHGETAIQLETLGKLPEDINKAGASLIRQQVMLGRTQRDVGDNLAGQTKQYILELDRLQRLTGLSADAIQKKQEEALLDSAYASYMDELMESGEAGKKQADYIKAVLLTLPEEYAKLARQGLGGDVGAYGKLNYMMPSLMMNLRDGSATLANTVETNEKELKIFKNEFRLAYQGSSASMEEFAGKFITQTQAISMASNIRRRIEEVGIEQAQAELKQDVKNMATSAVNERERTANLQTMIQHGVGPATTALAGLAKAANSLTSWLPGSKGATTGAGDADVDKILQTIKNRESFGGNYKAQSPDSTASGAYQFIDGTWQALTKKYGMGQEFTKAKMAPKEIQDAIAKRYVEDILKQAGGDVSKVPLAWYTGNIQGNLGGTKIAKGHPGVESYQNQWMKDYAGPNSGWQNSMSGANPASTLPAGAAKNQTTENAKDVTSEELLGILTDSLASMDRRLSNIDDNSKKTAQAQSR